MNKVTTEQGRKLLEGCALFKALDQRERYDLAARSQLRSFAATEPIFHVGDPGHSMIGVIVGTVRIPLPTRNNRL